MKKKKKTIWLNIRGEPKEQYLSTVPKFYPYHKVP